LPLIYPELPGQTFEWVRRPRFDNDTIEHVSGREVRVDYFPGLPIWEWELNYSVLRDFPIGTIPSELKRLEGFFLSVKAELGTFLFRDPDDFQVTGQFIETASGDDDVFPLVRTYGDTAFGTSIEAVGYVNLTQPFNVYLNGLPQPPSAYVLEQGSPGLSVTSSSRITFTTAPPAGTVVSVDMSYYFWARFAEDFEDFEQFAHQFWLLRSISLRSQRMVAIRPPPPPPPGFAVLHQSQINASWRTSLFSGTGDTPLGTLSVWLEPRVGVPSTVWGILKTAGSRGLTVAITSAGQCFARMWNVNGTSSAEFTTALDALPRDGDWHHLFWNWNTSVPEAACYIDGMPQTLFSTLVGAGFSVGYSGVNPAPFPYYWLAFSGGNFLPLASYEGCSQDLWFFQGVRVASPAAFRTFANQAVDLGLHGQIPTGTPPTLFFHYNGIGSPIFYYTTNFGTGGNMTGSTGANMTICADNPYP
jgi:hypothetical protein